MKIGVLSDTHIPLTCKKLPALLLDKLQGVDLIIHAGDLIDPSIIDELKKIAPTEAVCGNMDSNKTSRILPEKKILELGVFRIGVIHGDGAPYRLKEYIQDRFKDEKLDCIIYGHSHSPSIEYAGDILLFNPGSPTDKVFAPYNSFGILEITDKINPKIIRLE